MNGIPRGGISAIFVVFAIFSIPITALAQLAQCDNCLQDQSWTVASQTIPADPAGCKFDVDYRFRASSCNQYDIEIIGIKRWSPACSAPFNPGAMVSRALLHLLQANPMGFPPHQNGTCETQIRGFVSQCLGPNSQFDYLSKCGDAICCSRTYLVCQDDQGNRTVTPTGSSNPNGAPCLSGGRNCYPVCEEN